MRLKYILKGIVVAAFGVSLLASGASAAGPVSVTGLSSQYQVTPGTADQTITVSVSLSAAPGNAVTLRSSLDGSVPEMTIKSGASLVFSPANYSTAQNVVINVSTSVAIGKTSALTLQGSGITTATSSIQVVRTVTTGGSSEKKSVTTLQSLLPGATITAGGAITKAISFFFIVIALAAFFALLYSGFMYITAGGDTSQVEKARKNIGWAIIGVIIALLAYVIVLTVPALISKGLSTSSTGINSQLSQVMSSAGINNENTY